MKKLLLLVTSFVLGFVLIGCSSASKEEKKGIWEQFKKWLWKSEKTERNMLQ